jgi:hypothetical protein
LGVTAARAVFGRSLTIAASRGRALEIRVHAERVSPSTRPPSCARRTPRHASEPTPISCATLRAAARLLREGALRDGRPRPRPRVPTAATRRSGRRLRRGRRARCYERPCPRRAPAAPFRRRPSELRDSRRWRPERQLPAARRDAASSSAPTRARVFAFTSRLGRESHGGSRFWPSRPSAPRRGR